MKRKNKNILLGVTCGILAVTSLACIGHITNNNTGWFDELVKTEEKVDDDSIEYRDHGVRVRYVKSGTTAEGYATRTFNYTFTPANTTNKKVTTTLKYIDNSSCDDVMTVEVNAVEQTITLTCLKAFNKQIVLTVTSVADPSVKGVVSINYVKKVTNIEATDNLVHPYGYAYTNNQHSNNVPLKITYSDYSKDATFNIVASGGSVTINGSDYGSSYYETLKGLIEEIFLPVIRENILTLNNNSELPSAGFILQYLEELQTDQGEYIYNHLIEVYDANQSGEQPDQGYDYNSTEVTFTIDNLVVKVNNSQTFNVSGLKFITNLAFNDFSGFSTLPTSVDLESSNIDF